MTIYRCPECAGEAFHQLTVWEHKRSCSIGQERRRQKIERMRELNDERDRERAELIRTIHRPAWSEHDQEYPLGCGYIDCLRCYGGPPRVRTIAPKGGIL